MGPPRSRRSRARSGGLRPRRRESTADHREEIARDRIVSLGAERAELADEQAELHAEMIRQLTGIARLRQAAANARDNTIDSAIPILIGGLLLGYACLAGDLGMPIARASAGCLLAGIFLMLAGLVRRRPGG